MTRRRALLSLGAVASLGSAATLVNPKAAHAHDDDDDDDENDENDGYCYNNKKNVVLGLMGALDTLDADEIVDWLSDDVVFQNTGLPDVVGKEAVRAFLPPFTIAFESLVTDLINIKVRGRLVCTERVEHYTVSQTTPIGIPGATLSLKVAGWHEVRHGRVVRWSDYWDTRIFSATTGIPLPTL